MNGVRVLQAQLELRAHSEIKRGYWATVGYNLSSWVMNINAPPHPKLYGFFLHPRCLSTENLSTVAQFLDLFPLVYVCGGGGGGGC